MGGLLAPQGVPPDPLEVGVDRPDQRLEGAREVVVEQADLGDPVVRGERLGHRLHLGVAEMQRHDPLAEADRPLELHLALSRPDRIGADHEDEGVALADRLGHHPRPWRGRGDVLEVDPDVLARALEGIVQAMSELPIGAGVGDEDVCHGGP